MSVTYGSKRLVVGAHYGFRDWLSQRVTAALMALFTVVVVVQVLLPRYVQDASGERVRDGAGQFIAITGYDKWAGMFAAQWMKVLTFAVIASLLWHVWVGMRDVLMDYVKPVGLRLAMQVFAIVWLTGCAGWAVQVLWRL
jgi:succinate dehydrogenase / fumarate reductase membrane anchor subunit